MVSFACLDLFGERVNGENAECNDVETRKRILAENFQPALEQGLSALLRDGGHVGRCAAEAAETLRMGLADVLGYDGDDSDDESGPLDDFHAEDFRHGSNRHRNNRRSATGYDGAQDILT